MRIFTVLVFSPGVCRLDAERSVPRAQALRLSPLLGIIGEIIDGIGRRSPFPANHPLCRRAVLE